jgi:hypothetical protein
MVPAPWVREVVNMKLDAAVEHWGGKDAVDILERLGRALWPLAA